MNLYLMTKKKLYEIIRENVSHKRLNNYPKSKYYFRKFIIKKKLISLVD